MVVSAVPLLNPPTLSGCHDVGTTRHGPLYAHSQHMSHTGHSGATWQQEYSSAQHGAAALLPLLSVTDKERL